MASATISRLKASLSELLLKVRAGEELYITDRGKTIAKIVPVKNDPEHIATRLRELEKSGLLRPGNGKIPADFWSLSRPKIKTSAVKALLKDREEDR